MAIGGATKNTEICNNRFLPYPCSYGVTPVEVVIARFLMFITEHAASAQKLLNTPTCNISRIHSFSVIFLLWLLLSFVGYSFPVMNAFLCKKTLKFI